MDNCMNENESVGLEIPITTHRTHLKKTLESVNLTGLKHFILNHLLNWCWTFQAYTWHVSSTFPPLRSSHSLRAAAVTHPPPSCLISSYFPDKWFGYTQVLILPAVPICLLSHPLPLPNAQQKIYQQPSVKISLQHSDTFAILLIRLYKWSMFSVICLEPSWRYKG